MPPLRKFSTRVAAWQRASGRRDLPWQGTRDPYRIWVSEIMLQQTQVSTVLGYYERFLARFPDVAALAAAPEDEVLALWAGLGYYRRARLMHAAARVIFNDYGGAFPRKAAQLETLPGIGRSTAAAIAVFAYDERAAILDSNVKRVLTRHAGFRATKAAAADLQRLWQEAEARLPRRRQDRVAYTQGLMDLGNLICTARAPRCTVCPVAADCVSRARGDAAQVASRPARKATRLRRQRFLLAIAVSEVLLHRRPAAGVWGGLWCLPELEPEEDLATAAARWGIVAYQRAESLPTIKHAFTHFEMEIVPERIQVQRRALRAAEPGSLWLPLDDLAGVGLPRPIERLLRMFSQSIPLFQDDSFASG